MRIPNEVEKEIKSLKRRIAWAKIHRKMGKKKFVCMHTSCKTCVNYMCPSMNQSKLEDYRRKYGAIVDEIV